MTKRTALTLVGLGVAVLALSGCCVTVGGQRVCAIAATPAPAPVASATASPSPSPAPTLVTATQPAAPSATAAPAPTTAPTAIAGLTPPALCLINPSSGFTPFGGSGHIDSTWWFRMGEAWRRAHPGWGGGDCAPCDQDHGDSWNGPCQRHAWYTARGTEFSFSGPAYVSGGKVDQAGANVAYNPGQLLIATVCPSVGPLIDPESGLEIPRNCRTADCCSTVSFVTP